MHKQRHMYSNLSFAYFLPNTTAWFQPMDQYILSTLKSKLRVWMENQVLITDSYKFKQEDIVQKTIQIMNQMNSSVYKASWLRTGIVKKEELAAFDGSAADSITEVQLIQDQLEKMELEDEMEEISDAENEQEEVDKDKENKQHEKKTFTQPKITSFFN